MSSLPCSVMNSTRSFNTCVKLNGGVRPRLSLKRRPITVMALNQVRETVIYSDFIKRLKNKEIENVLVLPNKSMITFESKDGLYANSRLPVTSEFIQLIEHEDVNIAFDFDTGNGNFLTGSLPFLVPIVLYFLIMRSILFGNILSNSSSDRGGFNPFGGGASERFPITENTGVKFSDVAGVDEAKEELEEIVDFLQNPEKYKVAGATIPKGCLVSGPPGTGKTLMAKAIAGEAEVPFISTSASEFVELFVGIGASRIRELFDTARKNSPCIIFIDEIDAIGKSRANTISYGGGGNDEREQTLNQLLTEMDGFNDNTGVVVLAATNREEILDDALKRPGRFDRKISIALPTSRGRERIMRIHAQNKRFECDDDLVRMASKTVGFNGADLMNLMNEASIMSVRNGHDSIRKTDLEEAFDKITIGLSRSIPQSDEIRKTVAYHEAGHTVVAMMLEGYDKVSKVSIRPRGATGGVTQFIPDEDLTNSGMYSRDYLIKRIIVGLGGRIAEEIVFGEGNVTTGAVNDLEIVTTIARNMVEQYGFSENVGLRKIDERRVRSSEIQNRIDEAISDILVQCANVARTILRRNRSTLERVAVGLIEKDTLDEKELLSLRSLTEDLKNYYWEVGI